MCYQNSLPTARAAILSVALAFSALPAQAQVLTRAVAGNPNSLDPHFVTLLPEFEIVLDLYEGLVTYDGAGKIVPGVAKTWDISADGLTYEFALRDDAFWSDATPVTAHDFVFGFDRLQAPETAAPYARQFDMVTDVTAVDEHRLTISLSSPTPYFIELLAMPAAMPLHRASIGLHGDAFSAPLKKVSNGPYTLEFQRLNDRTELAKSPYYQGKQQAYFQTVSYVVSEDENTCLRRFQASEVDSCTPLSSQLALDFGEILGDQLRIESALSSYYLSLNTSTPTLADRRVRRAIDLAIDRRVLAEDTLRGLFEPMAGWVPSGFAGYPATPLTRDFAGMTRLDRQLEAQALMAEAGYGPDKPLRLTLAHSIFPDEQLAIQEVARMLAPLNIEITTKVRDFASHYALLAQKQGYDIAASGWIADFRDPVTFLNLASNVEVELPNYTNLSNPMIETLLERADNTADPEKRIGILMEIERLILADHAKLALVTLPTISAVSNRIVGWQDNPTGLHPSSYLSSVK